MFFREEVVAETKWFEMAFSISWAAVCFGKPFLREQKSKRWDDFWFLGTTSRHICIETAMQCMNFKSSSLSMIVMLTVRRVAKGRPPTSASSPRQQTDSSWLFSRADLHTSLNPTEERDNGWWNVLPSHWLGSQPLQSRGNKKRSSHNSRNTILQYLQGISSRFLDLLLKLPHFLIKGLREMSPCFGLIFHGMSGNNLCSTLLSVQMSPSYKNLQLLLKISLISLTFPGMYMILKIPGITRFPWRLYFLYIKIFTR